MKRYSQGGNSPSPKHWFCDDSDESDEVAFPTFTLSPSQSSLGQLPSQFSLSRSSSVQSGPWPNFEEFPFSSSPENDFTETGSNIGKSSKQSFYP